MLYTKLLKEPGAHFYIHFKNFLTIVFVRIKIGFLGAFDKIGIDF